MRWIGLEKMHFIVDEKEKGNVVPVKLLSKERFVFPDGDCVIGNGQGNAWLRKQRKKGKHDKRESYMSKS